MQIHVTPGFFLILAIYYAMERSGLFWCIVPAVLLHETGHALAIRICGGRITELTFSASGLRMDYRGQFSYWRDALIAAAGPVVNLICAFLFAVLYRLGRQIWIYAAGVNLILAAVNLIPAESLDGGAILEAALYRFLPVSRVHGVLRTATVIFSVLFLIFGLYIGIKTRYNISVLCLGAGLCIRAILSDKEKCKWIV